MSKPITLTLDKKLYKQVAQASRQGGYLAMQELIRDMLREKFEKNPIEKFGEKLEKKIKRIV
ncbi:MAG TPA: hypothetical protein HA224_01775 [Nanoarchaeota archaeon]|nr:hypothetical protein [Nanoarchaeota archaeon]